jgi:hybrid cluster-associated redox disulfide protein
MKKITPKTKLNELLEKKPDAAGILFEAGLSCIGCPMAMQETIEQGCLAHGMSKKQIDDLIKRLNRK